MKGTRLEESTYDKLPQILNLLMQEFEDGPKKDAVLLSVITSLGAAYYDVSGKYFKETLHPNLMTFIIAPPSSGKGDVKLGPDLVSGIQKRALEINLAKSDANGPEKNYDTSLHKPLLSDLMLPGNSSYAAIVEHLDENNGVGFIFETEADTISKIINMEWGDFSDFLRKAYHHEPVSIRRKEKKPITIDKPKVSILLTGTSNQIEPMINSVENGLFSRFCFFYFESEPVWINPNPRLHQHVLNMTDQTKSMVSDLWETITTIKPVFELEEYQWEYLSKVFEDQMKEFVLLEKNQEYHAILKRLGSMAFRIAMILEVSEYLHCNDKLKQTIKCSSPNLETAIKITKSLLSNSQEVAGYLTKKTPLLRIKKPKKSVLLENLPNTEFKRHQAIELGQKLGISERSVDDYLNDLVRNEHLTQPKTGSYIKTAPG